MCPAPSKTLVARLKRDAKARAKQDSISHSAALEQLAADFGSGGLADERLHRVGIARGFGGERTALEKTCV